MIKNVCHKFALLFFSIFYLFTFAFANEKAGNEAEHLKSLIEQRKYEEALSYIKSTEPEKAHYEFYRLSAEFFMKTEKYLKAIDYFKLAYINAKDQKEKDYTMLKRGECYLNLRYYNEAYLILKNLIKNSPNSIYLNDAYLLFAQTAESLGKIDEALSHYQKVPPTLSAQIIKAKAYVRMGRFNEAVKIFENMLKTEKGVLTENPDIYYYFGEALRNTGRYKEAKTYLSGAKRLAGFKDKACLSLGIIANEEKDFESALSYFKEVSSLDREAKAKALYYIGKIYLNKNLKKEAKESFIALRNNYPVAKEYKEATLHLVTIARVEKNYDSVYRYLNELLKSSKVDEKTFSEMEALISDLYEVKGNEFNKAFQRYGVYLYKARRFDTLIKVSDALPEDKREQLLNQIFLVSLGEEKKKTAKILFEYYVKKNNLDKALKFENYVDKNQAEKIKLYDYLLAGNYDKVLSIIMGSKEITDDDVKTLLYISNKVKDKKKFHTIISKTINNNLKAVTYVSLGDYFFEKDKKLALKCYQKALAIKELKPEEKEEISRRVQALEKKEKLPEFTKHNEFKDVMKKLNDKEETVNNLLKGYNL